MKKLLCLLLLMLSACAPFKVNRIDPAFLPIVEEFTLLYGHPLPALSIVFGATPQDKIATCDLANKYITVNAYWWNDSCLAQKRAILFHELGHCALNRLHTDNIYSYMYPQIRDCIFYETNVTILDEELFL
jgi:hypothetical protein